MAWTDFKFTPEDGLSNTTTFPSKPTSGAAARAQFMTILNQIKTFFNGTVKNTIDEHKAENVHIGKNDSVKVRNSANQSIPNGVNTQVIFDNVRFDSNYIFDSLNSKFACKVAGIYLINANIEFASNNTGTRGLFIFHNTSSRIAFVNQNTVNGFGNRMHISTIYKLNEGDTIECGVWQNSGDALDLLFAGSYSSEFSMVRVG